MDHRKWAYLNVNDMLRGYLVLSQHFICDKYCEIGEYWSKKQRPRALLGGGRIIPA